MFIGTPCIIKVGDVKIENLSNTTKKYGMMEVSYKISKNVQNRIVFLQPPWFSNSYIFATQCRRALDIQTINSVRSNDGRLKPFDCKDTVIRKFKYVVETQFLYESIFLKSTKICIVTLLKLILKGEHKLFRTFEYILKKFKPRWLQLVSFIFLMLKGLYTVQEQWKWV